MGVRVTHGEGDARRETPCHPNARTVRLRAPASTTGAARSEGPSIASSFSRLFEDEATVNKAQQAAFIVSRNGRELTLAAECWYVHRAQR